MRIERVAEVALPRGGDQGIEGHGDSFVDGLLTLGQYGQGGDRDINWRA